MKFQQQNHQKTHNFSYKTEIQFIPASEIFDVNHFKINEPILIVKFNSHCIETSQVDEVARLRDADVRGSGGQGLHPPPAIRQEVPDDHRR